jgi:hypothetical protein
VDDNNLLGGVRSAGSGDPGTAVLAINAAIAAVGGTYASPRGLWCQSVARGGKAWSTC